MLQKTFKLRAECHDDIIKFIVKAKDDLIAFRLARYSDVPNVYFTFSSTLSLEEIRSLLLKIKDGHVMAQTVSELKNFNDERNYDIVNNQDIKS